MTTPFETAEMYDCKDAEALQHETPEEAIIEYLDPWYDGTASLAAVVAEHSPVTVHAFVREVISDAGIQRQCQQLARATAEVWDDEYGDPDGAGGLSQEARAAFAAAIEPHLRALWSSQPVWSCSQVAERTYSADEVMAIARAEWPGDAK